MKVVLTGYRGFVGSYLKPYLEKQGHEVIGIDIKDGNDILVCDLPSGDLVIHLAAKTGIRESLEIPDIYWNVNVNGTRRILEHYKDTRVLVASSSSQYEPYLNPYAASKHTMETIPHINVCWMRFHTIYGPTSRDNMFFDKLRKNTLTYVTDHMRDFIHINDICNAINILINNNINGPVDIGTGVSVKVSDICPGLPIKTDSKFERKVTCADTTIMSNLGFIPSHYLRT